MSLKNHNCNNKLYLWRKERGWFIDTGAQLVGGNNNYGLQHLSLSKMLSREDFECWQYKEMVHVCGYTYVSYSDSIIIDVCLLQYCHGICKYWKSWGWVLPKKYWQRILFITKKTKFCKEAFRHFSYKKYTLEILEEGYITPLMWGNNLNHNIAEYKTLMYSNK